MKHRVRLFLAILAVLSAGSLRAADSVAQVLARARAYLGSESALNSVTTIHFTGSIEVNATTRLPIDIVFQKPYQQRITMTGPQVIEVTALDGYDAWQKRTNPSNPSQWQVTLLDAEQVKRLRANTWENLSFFSAIEKKGGRVEAAGEASIDGVACNKLSFIHADNIVFVRYFDRATGRLVKTETESGAEIREEGEMTVNGVRFPRKVINQTPGGPATTIVFDRIELNTPVPAAEFAVPAFKAN
jgi:hypothetical protein